MSESWLGALCAETDPELFFPEVGTSVTEVRQARWLCARCPLTADCLAEGLKRPYEGIWGGTTVRERMRMRKHPELIQQHLKELRASVRPTKQDN